MGSVFLAEMTREAIATVAPEGTVVVPLAATEQHGPHLPINVDTTICEHVAVEAVKHVRQRYETPIFVAPMLPFGVSDHHRPFAGVLSLTSQTFIRVLGEVLESLRLSGFRRMFLLNGHGGNAQAMAIAGQDMTCRHDVIVGFASYWDMGMSKLREHVNQDAVPWIPGHAGAFETSAMLSLRPDLVRQEAYPKPSAFSAETVAPGVSLSRRHWILSIDGYTDDPKRANQNTGELSLGVIVDAVAEGLVRFCALS